METAEIIAMAIGLGVPVLAAPFVVLAQRRLFSIFLLEGVELLGGTTIAKKDALALGSLLAKLDVLVLLVAWLALYTCQCLDQSMLLVSGIAILGVFAAVVVTTLIVHANIRRLDTRTVTMVGLIVFAGGNLPLIVVAAVLMVFL